LIAAVLAHLLQFLQTLNRLLDGRVVGEQASEPAVIYVVHLAARRLLGDGFLRLALGAHKEDGLAFLGEIADKLGGFFEELEGLLEVDNVNAVAFPVYVFLHLGIPTARLVAEMNPSLQKFLHTDVRQITSQASDK